ncbi:response regulator [Reinekea blandensis]|uniref:Putative transcriptional regulator, LuxR family protein n=1 Tax=Reinekea blandensis MED297 TaxID=314283 RepID=A4BEK3_9GAMM|nr:response regulator transcription factor [Reinekea blandensis]EAR09430.1 putative transcriptional regulator, LuxR family protein [Reinekea sp. MED297] [Reinekea blandensis MED297]
MTSTIFSDQLNILIADDHPLFRQALSEALGQTRHTISIQQVQTLADTLAAADQGDIDLILLDLKMPDCVGLMGLIELREKHPETAIAVVTANESSQTMRKVRSAGAVGYLIKSMELESLVNALNTLLEGGRFFSLEGIQDPQDIDDDIDAMKKLASLTPKQQHVLSLISRGYLNKQIAYELDIKETTVKTHVSEIFRKLGIFNRTQAAIFNQYLNVNE